VTQLSHLLSLNLQNNFLANLPAGLDNKKYLQQLNLAKNRLKDFKINLPHCLFLNVNGTRKIIRKQTYGTSVFSRLSRIVALGTAR
jgi:Leucine-rich repeat (LRR) protein